MAKSSTEAKQPLARNFAVVFSVIEVSVGVVSVVTGGGLAGGFHRGDHFWSQDWIGQDGLQPRDEGEVFHLLRWFPCT